MPRLLLLHHLGLGDHFMCHGIVREYAGRYSRVTIFSYPHNYPTVAFMFRDLANVDIRQVKDVEEARAHLRDHRAEYDETKVLGFENLDRTTGTALEKQFYDQAGVPLRRKWEGFRVERDHAREQTLFEKLAPPESYAFVHEDAGRKYIIKRRLIGNRLPQFEPRPELTDNVFDYCTLIERATEIHVIDSSFMFLIDCMQYDHPEQKLVVHRYARENNDWQLPILRKDWHILTAEMGMFDPLRKFLERLYRLRVFPFVTSFFRRAVRWFFRQMLWTMGRPNELQLEPILRRYVPERTFAEVGNARYIAEAKAAGAAAATNAPLSEVRADVVLYQGDPWSILPELRKATGVLLMLVAHLPVGAEKRLRAAGFEVREHHIFPGESCLVCRAV